MTRRSRARPAEAIVPPGAVHRLENTGDSALVVVRALDLSLPIGRPRLDPVDRLATVVLVVGAGTRRDRDVEPDLPYGNWLFTRTDKETSDIADSVAQSAVGAVYRLGLKALVVPTTSGRTARLVSAHRPNVPVLAISPPLSLP